MWMSIKRHRYAWTLMGLFAVAVGVLSCTQPSRSARNGMYPKQNVPARHNIGGYMFKYPAAENVKRSPEELAKLNAACIACHTQTDGDTMHNGKLSNPNATAVSISCADCHGGNIDVAVPAGMKKGEPEF